MELFQVYPLYDVTPERAEGCYVFDDKGKRYLDLYGGHGVISIGHSHPDHIAALSEQLGRITFYSNSVNNPLQEILARKLGALSGCNDYRLFLCNSGAEANENALKLASFHTGRKRLVAFERAFHGRTSAAVAVTDNPRINAALNAQHEVAFLPLNRADLLEEELRKQDVAAVILEGIQGVGGLDEADTSFFKDLREITRKFGTLLILDEIQSGYGRSGKFFAFQHHGIEPDIITTAKGMGNGFPIGGVLIAEHIEASYGMLGTTFGGSHLACAAGISVLDVLEKEDLLANVRKMHLFFMEEIRRVPRIKGIKGKGLMLGVEFDFDVSALRRRLIFEEGIFTGGSSNKNLLRILPPLSVREEQIRYFTDALIRVLENE